VLWDDFWTCIGGPGFVDQWPSSTAYVDAILRLDPACSQSPMTSVKETAISFMEAIFHDDFPSENDQCCRRGLLLMMIDELIATLTAAPIEDQSGHQDHQATNTRLITATLDYRGPIVWTYHQKVPIRSDRLPPITD
jgi:hypothetical protein